MLIKNIRENIFSRRLFFGGVEAYMEKNIWCNRCKLSGYANGKTRNPKYQDYIVQDMPKQSMLDMMQVK